MLEPFRSEFNANFNPASYQRLIESLERETGERIDFRVCETPCFFTESLLNAMAAAGR